MKIIEVRPSKKFKGAWIALEAHGVEPAFRTTDAKADAISYAKNRFGEKIAVDGGTQYGKKS